MTEGMNELATACTHGRSGRGGSAAPGNRKQAELSRSFDMRRATAHVEAAAWPC